MVKEVVTAATVVTRRSIRKRFVDLRSARASSTLRVEEISGLTAAGALLLVALTAYFYQLAPARARLASLQTEQVRLQKSLQDSTAYVRNEQDAATTIEQIIGSLRGFEYERLAASNAGRTAVLGELNNLIRRNSARISGPIAFTPIEALTPEQASQARENQLGTTAVNAQSIFPGIGIKMSVEGAYSNLRRLVRDIEASRQFIVINGVELEGATDSSALNSSSSSSAATTTGQAMRGAIVSLRLEMTAYFRRNAAVASS